MSGSTAVRADRTLRGDVQRFCQTETDTRLLLSQSLAVKEHAGTFQEMRGRRLVMLSPHIAPPGGPRDRWDILPRDARPPRTVT